MAVYTVHEPPTRDDDAAPAPERFIFVRDGFSLWAFVLGPLWMLWRRLWLVLLGYVLLAGALHAGLYWINAPGPMRFAVFFLIAVLIGLEASSLRRWTLGRRGWRTVGVVVGDDPETAEHRFFDSWAEREAPMSASMLPTVSRLQLPPASPHVIGLFPEPGAPR